MILKKKIANLILAILGLTVLFSFSCSSEKNAIKESSNNKNTPHIALSIDLMEAVKAKDESKINEIQTKLASLEEDSLAANLMTDNQKKAFWINIYNAYIQILLTKNPALFEDRGDFFSKPRIKIANQPLSFDNIEHGIIRSSKFKLALGLVSNPFANSFEKKFRTIETDGRVHFALNCGAKSCPPIAIYNASTFDEKVDHVAKHFLEKASSYNVDENRITTTPLFSWFRGDFGGEKGMLKLLKNYQIISEDKKPTITFDDYDWTLSLGNYYEEN